MITVRTTSELLQFLHDHIVNYDFEPDDECYTPLTEIPKGLGVPLAQLESIAAKGAFKFGSFAVGDAPECWGPPDADDDERLEPLRDWVPAEKSGVYFHASMVVLVIDNSDHGGFYIPNYLYGWAA